MPPVSPPRGPVLRVRRGAVLPVVAFLIVVLAATVVIFNRIARQRSLEVHRQLRGLVATMLAESTLNAGWRQLRASAAALDGAVRAQVLEAPAADLDGATFPLEVEGLDALLEPFDGEASAALELAFTDVQAFLPPQGPAGLAGDPREKFGTVEVRARASYRGVTRVLSAPRGFKVASVLAPALSKFTLFLREQGDQEVNCLRYDRVRPGRAMLREGSPARPVVLFHEDSPSPAVVGDRFHSLAAEHSDRPLDEGGLVYLGGPEPWYLNLTHGTGAGPFDELFLLRRARHRIAESSPPRHRLWFGLYGGLFSEPAFQAAGPGADPPTRPDGAAVPEETAAVHLSGNVDDVSPTLVLGPVARAWVGVPFEDGRWYPHLSEAEFSRLAIRAEVAASYPAYRARMARVVHDPYNRSADYLRTNGETVDDQGLVDTDEPTPVVPPRTLAEPTPTRVEAVDGDLDALLYPAPGSPDTAAVVLRRPEDAVAPEVFRGDLDALTPEVLGELLRAKAAAVVPDAAALRARFERDGLLRVPGVVLVERGELDLGPAAVWENGGMIVAEEGVRITGWVRRTGEVPLTLVSLAGDIVVDTDQRVDAHLVALAGRLRATTDQLYVVGAVAAGRADWQTLTYGVRPKWVRYDLALDPTDHEAYRASLQLAIQGGGGLHLTAEVGAWP